ncbi:MAG: MucR family transcriptional regulator [Acidisphaera sp.]|nr:MucR family transcriptional regulator [Acidisphaera sp.]
MSDSADQPQLMHLTAQIVSAHVSHNSVTAEVLPSLIREVYTTLNRIRAEPDQPRRPEPAVPIKKSVFPDYIVCLEDGAKLKMLKRHLRNAYGMTPEQYRERWGLPRQYPMVAPNYAQRRSSLAKQIGLGTKRTAAAPASDSKRPKRRPASRGRGGRSGSVPSASAA